jgi:putative peptide zinc metalloprotease protein
VSPRARRPVVLLAAIACALPLGSAQAAGSDNVATAINQQDNSQVFDFAWDIDRQRDPDVVDDLNSALAHASCTHCGATAIAFQVILVSGSPGTVIPKNTAEAANIECAECTAVAEARQFVRVVPRPVRFTGAGRATLADVKQDLAALQSQNLGPLELHAAVEAQEARVKSVLDNELVLKSDPSSEPKILERRTFQSADLD